MTMTGQKSPCFFAVPWEWGSLIVTALGRADVLYVEQSLALFLRYILNRAFPVLCYSFSTIHLASQRLSFSFI